jgi:hypothetical protein
MDYIIIIYRCINTILFYIYPPFPPFHPNWKPPQETDSDFSSIHVLHQINYCTHKKTETFNLFLIVIMDFPKLWPIVMFFLWRTHKWANSTIFWKPFSKATTFWVNPRINQFLGSSLWQVSGPLTSGSEKNQRTYPELPILSFTHKK